MSNFDKSEYESLERQLRSDKPTLSAIELDRVKQDVLTKAGPQRDRGLRLKPRLVAGLLVLGLVGTGGGAVLAASGGSSSKGSAANSQYCPESSPGAGKPKHQGGGNKCGHPPDGDKGKKDKKDK